MKKRESKLWQRIKKNCVKPHFTRLESNTINGIPDINGCWAGHDFWIELKSDEASYPKLSKWQISWINKRVAHGGIVLICKETLSECSLKLYGPLSAFTDARKLKPRFKFTAPIHWISVQDAIWEIIDHRTVKARYKSERETRKFIKDLEADGLTPLELSRQ